MNKYVFTIALIVGMIISLCGCGDNVEKGEIESTSAYDELTDYQKQAYDAIIELSSEFKNDSSIRIRNWYTEEESPSTYTEILGLYEISGENSMGGNTISYFGYNLDEKKLEKLDEDNDVDKLVITTVINSDVICKQPVSVIDKLNRAIVEYFETRGY